MRDGGKRWAAAVLLFAGLLVLAAAVSRLLALIHMAPWLHAFLVFAATKILADILAAIFRSKEKKYLFFEDYLREILLFFAVAAICVLGIEAVQHYLQGRIWLPLPAAAIIMIWR